MPKQVFANTKQHHQLQQLPNPEQAEVDALAEAKAWSQSLAAHLCSHNPMTLRQRHSHVTELVTF